MTDLPAPFRRGALLVLALAAPMALGGLAATPASAAPADDSRINEVVTTGSVNAGNGSVGRIVKGGTPGI